MPHTWHCTAACSAALVRLTALHEKQQTSAGLASKYTDMISCTRPPSPVDSSTRWHGKPERHGCICVRQVRQLFCRLRKGQIAVQHCLHMPAYAIPRARGLHMMQLQYRCHEAAPWCQMRACSSNMHVRGRRQRQLIGLRVAFTSFKPDMCSAYLRMLQQQGLASACLSPGPQRHRIGTVTCRKQTGLDISAI